MKKKDERKFWFSCDFIITSPNRKNDKERMFQFVKACDQLRKNGFDFMGGEKIGEGTDIKFKFFNPETKKFDAKDLPEAWYTLRFLISSFYDRRRERK